MPHNHTQGNIVETTISQLLDEAEKYYRRAGISFFVSGLCIGAGIGYLITGK